MNNIDPSNNTRKLEGTDDEAKMEAFVALCDGVERNDIGNTMKCHLIELGIIRKCLDYLTENAPKTGNRNLELS